MPQITQHSVSLPNPLRSHRAIVLAGLLALLAAMAVVLVLVLGGDSPANQSAGDAQPQSAVAASAGSHPGAAGPDESRIATSISGGSSTQLSSGPDESRIAASISGR